MPIKSWMSLILGQIQTEHPELFALDFGKIAESDFVYTLASANIEKINIKLGQNVCDNKTLEEFNYGSNRTRTVWVICPWIWKFAIFDFVYTLASANIDQPVANLATIYMPIKSQMSSILGQIESEHPE